MIHYRKAESGDLKSVIALAYVMHQESPYYSQYEPDFGYIEQMFNYIIANDQFGILACDDEVPIGMMFGFISKIPFIMHEAANEVVLYVKPSYRDGIVGPRLIKLFESWANKKGIDTVATGVSAQIDSSRVDELYRRLGYQNSGNNFHKYLN